MAIDKDERKQIRTFGFGLTALFAIFGTVSLFRHGWVGLPWQYFVSAIALIVSLVGPILLWPVYKIAMLVAHALGWVNSRLFLGLIFYLVFMPVSLLFKLFGKDPLDRKIEKERVSYWQLRDLEIDRDPAHWERQF